MVKVTRSEKTKGHPGRHDASFGISNGLSLPVGVLIFVKFVFIVVEILP